jgi:eukaryotic-like serine/threonine-protein kinase
MQPERWKQISRLYHAAAQYGAGEQAAFLDHVCLDDPALRGELESLLGHERSDDGLSSGTLRQPLPSFVGRTLGSYEVQALLGAGGMGQVYRARDTKLNRDVALKILPRRFALDEERLARFRLEARMLASLNHPNIAQIYGVEEADGAYGLVLELVEGPTLADRIAHGPFRVSEALAIARQVVDALAAAHDRHVVHRDLKPANIKVRPDGTVKVLDFGLAKALAPEAIEVADDGQLPAATLTARGVILGTVPYMAPEQARGQASDARVDIWAFGATLYEMLTGRSPFAAENLADTVGAVLYREPQWDNVPGGLQPLLRRCLEKDPARRPRTMADVRALLEDSQTSAGRSRRRAIWLAAAATVSVMATAGLATVDFGERQPVVYPVRFKIPAPPQSTFDGYFVVSPDGRHVAFVAADAAGQRSIWVHSLESGESRPLPRVGDVSTSSIVWSADSRFIGFVDSDANLKTIAIAGGAAQTIFKVSLGWGGAAWNRDNLVVVGQRTGGLMRVAAGGGAPAPLTVLDASRQEIGHGGPRLLPDGRHFIYSRASSVRANTGLYLGSVDAAPADQPSQPLLVTESRPAYAPAADGRLGHLLLVRDGVLLAYPFDEGRLALAGEPVPIAEGVGAIQNGNLSIASVSASTNGVLTYRNTESYKGIPTWVDRNGRRLGDVVSEPLDAPAFPRMSPDGGRIALIVGGNLWVYHTDGRPPIKLTFDGDPMRPLWTRDGQRIVYVDNRGGGQLRSVPADRVATPEVASPPGRYRPDGWAPDGSLLAATYSMSDMSGGTVTDVDIVKFTPNRAATPQPLVKTPAIEGGGGLALSPDGRWLAYTSNVTGRSEIWVQPFAGPGPPVRVSPNGGLEPRWAHGGEELYYVESSRMMAVGVSKGPAFDFGPPTVLFENRSWTTGIFYYDVGADGRFLIIPSGPFFFGTSPINVVINWRRLLTTTGTGG